MVNNEIIQSYRNTQAKKLRAQTERNSLKTGWGYPEAKVCLKVLHLCDIMNTRQGRYYILMALYKGGILLILRATTDYSIRIMAYIAKCNKVVSSTEIAEHENISPKYLIKVAALLRDSDLIISSKGAGGGYALARPSSEITMWEIIRCVDPELCASSNSNDLLPSAADTAESLLTKRMFEEINRKLRNYFNSITLSDFVNQVQNSTRSRKDGSA